MSLITETLFGVEDKVAIAIERIKTFCPPEGYYVAFSGGKDSIVALDLVRRSGVKHDAHFNFTTVDAPEVLQFIQKHYPDVEWHYPKKSLWQLIVEKRMPPTRTVRFCCEYLKERGGFGRFVITGVRHSESVKRAGRQLVEECRKSNEARRFLHPIIEWSDCEVWEYIRSNKLPYPSLYDEGFTRIGCVGCPNSDREMAFRRWPKFERAWRHAVEKCVQERLELITHKPGKHRWEWDSAENMWSWWMNEDRETENSDQGVLFE